MTLTHGLLPATQAFLPSAAVQVQFGSRPTLLLVEDDANDALLLSHALAKSSLGLKVQWMGTAEEALDYLSGAGMFVDRRRYAFPELLVLDLALPGMSGFEFLRLQQQMATEPAAVPVVVWSGTLDPTWKRRALGLGARAFVEKEASGEHWGVLISELARALRWAYEQPMPTR